MKCPCSKNFLQIPLNAVATEKYDTKYQPIKFRWFIKQLFQGEELFNKFHAFNGKLIIFATLIRGDQLQKQNKKPLFW